MSMRVFRTVCREPRSILPAAADPRHLGLVGCSFDCAESTLPPCPRTYHARVQKSVSSEVSSKARAQGDGPRDTRQLRVSVASVFGRPSAAGVAGSSVGPCRAGRDEAEKHVFLGGWASCD